MPARNRSGFVFFDEAEFERMIIRRSDFSLSEEQAALSSAYRTFFDAECPSSVVRAAEPLGFDAALWHRLVALGTIEMGLAEAAGGDGASLLDLGLVAEHLGSHLAPLPMIEAVISARLLARVGFSRTHLWLDRLVRGEWLMTFMPIPQPSGHDTLVPAGALADAVLALDRDDLVVLTLHGRAPQVPNIGCSPIARISIQASDVARAVVATGTEARVLFTAAQREWQLLTATALVGMGQACLDMGVEYAQRRAAFGVPIGFFQAISHPLVDVAIGVECARRLTRKASWFMDNEPTARPELVSMAFVQARRAATKAAQVAIHVLGGIGYTLECDAQLYYRRAQAWAGVGGDPGTRLAEIADLMLGASAVS